MTPDADLSENWHPKTQNTYPLISSWYFHLHPLVVTGLASRTSSLPSNKNGHCGRAGLSASAGVPCIGIQFRMLLCETCVLGDINGDTVLRNMRFVGVISAELVFSTARSKAS